MLLNEQEIALWLHIADEPISFARAIESAVIEKLREALIAGWSLQCDFDDARKLADEAIALSTDSTTSPLEIEL